MSVVARRHGLTPQQLFTWRREARKAAVAPTFVPAVITPEIATEPEPVKPPRSQVRRGPRRRRAAAIEIDVDGRQGDDRERRLAGHDRGGDRRLERAHRDRPTGAVRVMVATKPVDFRKGAEGLAALVRESRTMGSDPFNGVVYVFRAKRADRVEARLLRRHWRVSAGKAAGRREVLLARYR